MWKIPDRIYNISEEELPRPRLRVEDLPKIRERYHVGQRITCRLPRYTAYPTANHSEPVRVTIVGIYEYFMVIRRQKGYRESITWVDSLELVQ